MPDLKMRGRELYRDSERPLSAVPRSIMLVLVLALSAQLYWRSKNPAAAAAMTRLPPPPAAQLLKVVSIGEQAALSYLLMLWLQAFDQQPGHSIPLKTLDYHQLSAWLATILELHPHSQYPLLSAARIYSAIADEARQRIMLDFILEKYLQAPNTRWPAMAHATFIARHRLQDLPLALRYASALRRHTTDEDAPSWLRQMELFVLEDLGEIEAARILLGGLWASGAIKDARELAFLQVRLGLADTAADAAASSNDRSRMIDQE